MKIRAFIFCLLLSNNGLCSWPDETTTAAVISADPVESLSHYLEDSDKIYATAGDYRGLTLKFNKTKSQWECSVPVAYYQNRSWLSDAWDDSERAGWSRHAGNGLENVHSDLASLVGILDEAEIEFRRVSVVRTDRKTKDLRAIWNKLEFSIPRDRIAVIYPFMKDLYGGYRPDTEVHLYITKKKSSKPEMATPNQEPE